MNAKKYEQLKKERLKKIKEEIAATPKSNLGKARSLIANSKLKSLLKRHK